jgi:hypothetical protein
MKMVVMSGSEMLVTAYKITQHHNQEYYDRLRSEDLESQNILQSLISHANHKVRPTPYLLANITLLHNTFPSPVFSCRTITK